MKINTFLGIGEFHSLHCEDFLITEPLSSSQKLIAVMDGCTMAKESVFASILYGKVLRNIARAKYYEDLRMDSARELKSLLREILQNLFEELRILQNQMALEANELMSTLIVGVIDTKEACAELLTVGDGLIVANGIQYEYDQNDKPDYLGYHLAEDFKHWYSKQQQRISLKNITDLSISTDGIFSFKNLKDGHEQISEEEIINFLLIDKEGMEFNNFFDRKIRALEKESRLQLTDDLALIRMLI